MYLNEYCLPGQFRCEQCGYVKGLADYQREDSNKMMILIGSVDKPPCCNLCKIIDDYVSDYEYSNAFINIGLDVEKDDGGS